MNQPLEFKLMSQTGGPSCVLWSYRNNSVGPLGRFIGLCVVETTGIINLIEAISTGATFNSIQLGRCF